MNEERLDKIGRKYGTDKSSMGHGYLDIYDFWLHGLRGHVRKVLEIGIGGGGSLKMWADYFPFASIIGVDINNDFVRLDYGDRIETFEMDVSIPESWIRLFQNMGGGFDLIVDDGSHTARDMIAAFESGWPLLKPDGLYFVEDLHASYDVGYNRRLLPKYPHLQTEPTKHAIKFFLELVHQVNENGEGQTGKPSGKCDIDFIMFAKSLCIIRKGPRGQ
jgi:hypothetical protein